jgi:hypothetical protein
MEIEWGLEYLQVGKRTRMLRTALVPDSLPDFYPDLYLSRSQDPVAVREAFLECDRIQ